jgi:hypothetical protein
MYQRWEDQNSVRDVTYTVDIVCGCACGVTCFSSRRNDSGAHLSLNTQDPTAAPP